MILKQLSRDNSQFECGFSKILKAFHFYIPHLRFFSILHRTIKMIKGLKALREYVEFIPPTDPWQSNFRNEEERWRGPHRGTSGGDPFPEMPPPRTWVNYMKYIRMPPKRICESVVRWVVVFVLGEAHGDFLHLKLATTVHLIEPALQEVCT